jgi:hypothetical protein
VYEWDALKREVFDYGADDYYPAQGMFENAARRSIEHLSTFNKRMLIKRWRSKSTTSTTKTDEEILNCYAHYITNEIASRARVASSRTNNW